MKIHELKYSNTNTYLIENSNARLLFDTGWAGSFLAFCRCMGQIGIPVQSIDYIMISHFHPDHMGIASDIASLGAKIVVFDVQKDFIHFSDEIFKKENKYTFNPIDDEKISLVSVEKSREFLNKIGIDGQVIHTPGHSDDSISLYLDEGYLFVGDLNPLYELELYNGTLIEKSWNRLLLLGPKEIYYGHAKSVILDDIKKEDTVSDDRYYLVKEITHLIDKGFTLKKIQKKTGADTAFIEDVTRMYLTHQNVTVQGILDRIEIKGK